MSTTPSKYSKLFYIPTAKDKLSLFHVLLEAKEEMTSDIALALLKPIHRELSTSRADDLSVYKHYAEEIAAFQFHDPMMLQQVVLNWKLRQ